ncbi:hypothetical protein RRG08_025394 [Elysia crispata]|uniref:NADP-dependent 3-hydroxy acid dehydrogenase YdfG n=1 Tax=Elysia crispata TaxID=231223 RepID=A0AAE1B6J9_9GAST|nr:hypothetical protein RRG08_025394 [Elysia crispata]
MAEKPEPGISNWYIRKSARDSAPVDLSGQVAVITGASGGVGRCTALLLAEAGAKVCLGARRLEQLQTVVEEIRAKGGQAIAVQTDVAKRAEVKNLVAQAEKELGPVDILVNNAALWYFTMMTSLHEDDWDRMVDVNCKGLLNGIGAVLTGMVARKKGHIVNISSDSGLKGFTGVSVYCGTKFFVEGVTQSMRQELAKHNVKVTTIQPGYVALDGPERPQKDKEAYELCSPPADMEVLQPENIASAVLYAVTQPSFVAVNQMLVQPVAQPL